MNMTVQILESGDNIPSDLDWGINMKEISAFIIKFHPFACSPLHSIDILLE
jgi:hypothetical protein